MIGGKGNLKVKTWAVCANRRTFLLFYFLLFTFLLLLPTPASAQDEPPEAAPPPLKIIAKADVVRLSTKTSLKDRTKLSLELMNARLLAAESLGISRDFDGMYRELGVFHAFMDDALEFLDKRDNGGGKVLDNFKRMELGLRTMAPRLEVIRREIPLRYDPYVRKLASYLRAARTKATETLFDDTVVPNKRPIL